MKKVLLLGASGTAGEAITKRLTSNKNLELTLFSRHAKETFSHIENGSIINGDALIPADLDAAMTGQDVVYCAISGNDLPQIAKNIVTAMQKHHLRRLIFMGAVGIYNEIPDEMDGEDNVKNEPAQIPNQKAADIVEASDLDYTILRPGYLQDGTAQDYVLTVKGEPAKGYITTIPSLVDFAEKLILDDSLYVGESVSITRDWRKGE